MPNGGDGGLGQGGAAALVDVFERPGGGGGGGYFGGGAGGTGCIGGGGGGGSSFATSAATEVSMQPDPIDPSSLTITTGPTVPEPPLVTRKPSNAFRFGKLIRKKRKGTARLAVILPGPGALSLRGKGLAPVRRSVAKAGNRLAALAGCAMAVALVIVPAAAGATLITPKPEKVATVNTHVVQAPGPAPSQAPSSPSSAGAPVPSASSPPASSTGEAPALSAGDSPYSGNDLNGNPFKGGKPTDPKLTQEAKELADLLTSALWGKNLPPQLPSPGDIPSSEQGINGGFFPGDTRSTDSSDTTSSNSSSDTGGFYGDTEGGGCFGPSVPMITDGDYMYRC